MAHMVLRQLRREAQKFEASQDCKFLKQVSVFKNKSKKGVSGGEVRKQEVSALGRYREKDHKFKASQDCKKHYLKKLVSRKEIDICKVKPMHDLHCFFSFFVKMLM